MTPRYRSWQYAVAAAVFLGFGLGILVSVLRFGAGSYSPAYRVTFTAVAGLLSFIGIRYAMLANLARASRPISETTP